MTKTCPKTGSPCAGLCKKVKGPLNISFTNDKQWHKVITIDEIFEVFEKSGNKPYMLVAGNTAHGNIDELILFSSIVMSFFAIGVYRRKDNLQIFIDISGVEKLRSHSIGSEITLGGNVSLTETMEILTNASHKSGFEYAKNLVHHIDLIANVPVRNVSISSTRTVIAESDGTKLIYI